MDWHGIEWAAPIYEIAMIVLPVSAFITLYRRTKSGVLTKSRALLRYVLRVMIPPVLYGVFIGVLIGFEKLTRTSVISEELARTALLLIGLGVLIGVVTTIAFAVAIAFVKKRTLS